MERNRSRLALRLVAVGLVTSVTATVQAAPVAAPGFTVSVFAQGTNGNTQPDSVAVDGNVVYVGYGDGVSKTGTDPSTIVEYTAGGAFVQQFSVAGHNDGLRVDPTTHQLWALQNEDGNPLVAIINPATGTQTNPTIASVNGGGGFDDVVFQGGKTYISASSPASNPNSDPAIVSATLVGNTIATTPVLPGNAPATDILTGGATTLNLQDPDSMTKTPGGGLLLVSQSDTRLVFVDNPNAINPQDVRTVLTTLNGAATQVDDTVFTPQAAGFILAADLNNNTVYKITGPFAAGDAYSALRDDGVVGSLDTATGAITPIVTGLGSPRGLDFVAVPEPGSVTLLALGALGLIGFGRLRVRRVE